MNCSTAVHFWDSSFHSFVGRLGYLPHGRPVTMVNSLNTNLIGFSAYRNQASYFLRTFSWLDNMYLPRRPENGVWSMSSKNLQKCELFITSISCASRVSSMCLRPPGLWYGVTLRQTGSSQAAKIQNGKVGVSIFANRGFNGIKTWAWQVCEACVCPNSWNWFNLNDKRKENAYHYKTRLIKKKLPTERIRRTWVCRNIKEIERDWWVFCEQWFHRRTRRDCERRGRKLWR